MQLTQAEYNKVRKGSFIKKGDEYILKIISKNEFYDLDENDERWFFGHSKRIEYVHLMIWEQEPKSYDEEKTFSKSIISQKAFVLFYKD